MRIRAGIVTLLLVALLLPIATSVTAKDWSEESAADRDARMQWWREARFGMFIHWGLYAIPAGKWDGKPIGGIGEWIMDRANVPVDEYEKLATQFNPVKFDAAEWVKIAKNAGMKYMVITSKHHDGFCLFKSDVTDYNVVDGSPYGKDLLKPLAEECRKQGLKFCVYYSVMDWHHPAQFRANEKKYNPTQIHPGRKDEYMAFMKAQLRELLETCDPEVLWFDGEWPKWFTPDDGWVIYNYLRDLKPQLIINNRVGSGRQGMAGMDRADRKYAGDFGTPEQEIPHTGLPGVDWESCMTMNNTWGFKSDDHNWKSAETLIRNIIDIAAKGGNYLLNVGPTAEGQIPQPSVERLARIGQWMKANGESVTKTEASPFEKTPWGRCTRKSIEDGKTRLYLHVFKWPANGKLTLPNVKVAGSPRLLDGGQKLEHDVSPNKTVIRLHGEMPDRIATVVTVDVAD